MDTLKQNRQLTALASSGLIQLVQSTTTDSTRTTTQTTTIMKTKGNKGIQVNFAVDDAAMGLVPVNSLCGCNTRC